MGGSCHFVRRHLRLFWDVSCLLASIWTGNCNEAWLAKWAQHYEGNRIPSTGAFVRDAEMLLEYFGQQPGNATPARLLVKETETAGINGAEFAKYVRRGFPFVITDFSMQWPMSNWTCDSIAEDFGDERVMLWGYGADAGRAVDARGKRLPKYTPLKDRKWFAGFGVASPLAPVVAFPPEPQRASYHWHPYTWYGGSADDADPQKRWHMNEPLASKSAQRQIKNSYRLLRHLIPKSKMNARSFKERIEFFLGPPGSGANMHVDSICEPIVSVQICGKKRWWLVPLPPYEKATRQSANDVWRSEVLNEAHAFPGRLWEVDVSPGSALIFPAGIAHHTESLGDSCSVSASLQFRHPFAVQFIRDFAQRLMFSRENSFCFVEVWSVFLTGYFRGFVRLQKAVKRRVRNNGAVTDGDLSKQIDSAVTAEVGDMFRGIDKDADGVISPVEIKHHLTAEAAAMRRMDPELVEFDVAFEADDWMACHDLDEDGGVVWDTEYFITLKQLGTAYVKAQAEGACDEGCDTPLPKSDGAHKSGKKKQKQQPVDAYPGMPYDQEQKQWGHTNEL